MFPIHPAIVHFPIALLFFSVVADLLGYIKNSDSLRVTGRWSLLGALIGGVAAVLAGFFDWYRQTLGSEAQEHVRQHMIVGLIFLAVIAGLSIWRWFFLRKEADPGGAYLAAGILALGLTLYQGYLGHELVINHGVGVKAAEKEKAPARKADEHEHSH